MKLILPARKIPDRTYVTKPTGDKRYRLLKDGITFSTYCYMYCYMFQDVFLVSCLVGVNIRRLCGWKMER